MCTWMCVCICVRVCMCEMAVVILQSSFSWLATIVSSGTLLQEHTTTSRLLISFVKTKTFWSSPEVRKILSQSVESSERDYLTAGFFFYCTSKDIGKLFFGRERINFLNIISCILLALWRRKIWIKRLTCVLKDLKIFKWQISQTSYALLIHANKP